MDGEILGEHWVLDLVDCSSNRLNDIDYVEACACEACRIAGATILGFDRHQFEPQGVTVVVLLAESHLSIHTWPEKDYVAIDLLTCGTSMSPAKACEYLIDRFEAKHHYIARLDRGSRPLDAESIQFKADP